jgi:ABC-type sugar transport system ATPase subunit
VRRRREREIVRGLVGRLDVRPPTLSRPVGQYSGGNQQKVVLARWLATAPRVLLLDEPTRGIDVGAKAAIYALVRQLADEGMAVLFISSELPEVIGVSDRILVMAEGAIVGEVPAAAATEEGLLSMAIGHHLAATPSLKGAPA